MSRVSFGGAFGALPRGAVSYAFSQLWARRFLDFDLSLGGMLPTKITESWEASGKERSFVAGSLRLRTGLCHRPIGERVWWFSCLSSSGSWYYASKVDGTPTPENDYAVDSGSRSGRRGAVSASGVYEF